MAEAGGRAILSPSGGDHLRQLDLEDRNLRAAVDLALATGDVESGMRIMSGSWRWFHQRGRLREGRALLGQLLERPAEVDLRVRIAALAADGGLAYWMDDFPGARAAYEERLRLASATGDPSLEADAHYDLGFMSMVGGEERALRSHEERALELYTALGNEAGMARAHQALVLATFLAGEYDEAARLETGNLEAFRSRGSPYQVADSLTLLSAVSWRQGDPATAWDRIRDGLSLFVEADSVSGLARVLGMASIIQLANGDGEFGARLAGATYRLVREKGRDAGPGQGPPSARSRRAGSGPPGDASGPPSCWPRARRWRSRTWWRPCGTRPCPGQAPEGTAAS